MSEYDLDQMNQWLVLSSKVLLALNSGALLATVQIGVSEHAPPLDTFLISPAVIFAAGVTAILICFAINYFIFYFATTGKRPRWIEEHVMTHAATIVSVFSACLFISGAWIVALGL